jgi:hypothetical protein
VTLVAGGGARPAATTSAASSGASALRQAERAGIDIGSVIETVSHRLEPDRGERGRLASKDRLYRAQFGPQGFSLTLRRGAERQSALPAHAIPFDRAAAFAVETTRVLRGGEQLVRFRGGWKADRNSAQRPLAPALTERVVAREGEVDWGFVLDHTVEAGALRIEARISPAAAAGANESETAFRFPVTAGRRVTVGEFVVEGADGRELYRGQGALTGTTLALTVPGKILRDAAYPLTIDRVVSPEYPASDPILGARRGLQITPAVAYDGTNYLVVWEGGRIYGARVSSAGTVLDPVGIPISSGSSIGTRPAVAFDGTNYLVGWEEHRSGPTRVYGARVTPAGSVLDADGIQISTSTNVSSPALAFDGTNYLVAWEGGGIYGTRVSRAGSVLDPAGIPISTVSQYEYSPAIAFDGTNYLVAWQRSEPDSNIYAARVSPAGSVLDPTGIAISSAADEQVMPALAFDGVNYLVAWDDSRSGSTNNDIYGARVSPAGSVLDPAGIAISTAANAQTAPGLAFDGDNYLVVWQDYRSSTEHSDVYGARVSRAGAVLDPGGIAISTAAFAQGAPVLAFDGANYLVGWMDLEEGPTASRGEIRGARVSPAGAVLDPGGIAISTEVNDQSAPAIAFDGKTYLVVWQDYRSGAVSDIFGARVSQAGTLLDGAGIAIGMGNVEFVNEQPALAFDGRNFLVVWTSASETHPRIYGARVSPAGRVLDRDGIRISELGYFPAVAFDGRNYFVVSQQREGGIDGARVSPEGHVLDPDGITISSSGGGSAVAFDGTNYLVTWGRDSDLFGTRVSPAGGVLDPNGFAISSAAGEQFWPALAFDGTNYLVAWADTRSGTYADADIYGARVTPAGVVLDVNGLAISTAAGGQYVPALAFDGTNYLAAWQDSRSGASFDIYGARVSRVGTVFEPIAISTGTTDELAPAIARGSSGRGPRNRSGRVAVAYERLAPEAPYLGAERVFLRFLRPTSSPALTRLPPGAALQSGRRHATKSRNNG